MIGKPRKINIFIILLLCSLLVACTGDSGDPNGQSNESGKTTNPPTPQQVNAPPAAIQPKTDPVELAYYNSNNYPEERIMTEWGDMVKKKFPHVSIRIVTGKLGELVTTGEEIDLIEISIGQQNTHLTDFNLQYDLSDLIKLYNYDTSVLEPTTLEIQRQTSDGGMYGLPITTWAMVLFYNKEIFDKFGVPFPAENMTWDDMYDVARRLTRKDGDKQYYGFVLSPNHLLRTNQLSLPYVEPGTTKPAIQQPAFRQLVDNFTRFYEIPGYELNATPMTSGTTALKKQFYDDTATFAFLSGWRDPEMKEVDWDVVPLPTFKEAPDAGPQAYPIYLYLTSISKHKEQAFEVMSYVTSTEVQMHRSKIGITTILNDRNIAEAFGSDPSLSGFYDGKNVSAMLPRKFASPSVKTEYDDVVSSKLLPALAQIVKGEKDANTALREAEEAAQTAINELLEKK